MKMRKLITMFIAMLFICGTFSTAFAETDTKFTESLANFASENIGNIVSNLEPTAVTPQMTGNRSNIPVLERETPQV